MHRKEPGSIFSISKLVTISQEGSGTSRQALIGSNSCLCRERPSGVARGEAALGRQVQPARDSGEGQLDSQLKGVMTPCHLPQEEQNGKDGKAGSRQRWHSAEWGEVASQDQSLGVGRREQLDTDPPLSVCQIPTHLHSSGEDRKGEAGQECKPQNILATLIFDYVISNVFTPTWQPTVPFTATQIKYSIGSM